MNSFRREAPSRAARGWRVHMLTLMTLTMLATQMFALDAQPAAAQSADVVLTGDVSWTNETIIPAGEVWELNPSVDTTITTTANIIVEGTLRMRPTSGSVDHLIKFEGINEGAFQGGGHVPLSSDVGLWVVGAGVLDAVGTEKVPWSYDWQSAWAGDEVVAAPHTSGDYTNFKSVTSAAGVPAANTFGYEPELLNLSRNVRIEGTPGGKTHIFIKSSQPQFISYVGIRYVAPDFAGTDTTGRYGLHFHHNNDSTRGSIIEGVVVRDADNHAFVPHHSHGISFQNTIAYNTTAAAYWWDPSNAALCAGTGDELCNASDDTVYSGAIAAFTHSSPYSTHKSGAFHLGAGDGNVIVNSVAVGMQGAGADNAGYRWPSGEDGVWLFESNVAHNNDSEGVFVWQNTSRVHTINGFDVYFNKKAGIEHGAYNNAYVWQNVRLRGNGLTVMSHALGKQGSEPTVTDTQRWESIDTGGGTMAVMPHNPNTSSKPVRFVDCDFALVTFSEGSNGGGMYDFVECGLEVSDLDLSGALPDTIIRIQDGASAIQVMGSGTVTSIPVFFDGETSAPPAPPPATPPPPGSTPPPPGGGPGPIFADIGGSIFEADIVWLAETGITKGCNPPANTLFCPGSNVTRGQMAAFLVRALNLPAGPNAFTDVDDTVFKNDINALAAAGITKGCNPPANTKFCPDSGVTRGQMAAFLVRALNLSPGPDAFTDDSGLVFESDINALAKSGITKGCNPPANNKFCPTSTVNREQMAAFLHRAEDYLP